MCVNCLGLDLIIQQVLNKCLLLRTRTPHFLCGCATVGPTLALPRREEGKKQKQKKNQSLDYSQATSTLGCLGQVCALEDLSQISERQIGRGTS